MNALSLRMPRRFLRGNYARLSLTVIGLAAGVASITAHDLCGRETDRIFVEIIDTVAGRAALQVHAGEGALFPEDAAKGLADVPGVERVVPVMNGTAFTADERGELLTVHGMDLADADAVAVYELREDEGDLDDPKLLVRGAVVITQAFADRRGVTVGDELAIDTPEGRRQVTIRGRLDPKGLARVYGGNLLLMDLRNAQEMLGRRGFVNRMDVVVHRDSDVASVNAAIAARLPAGLQVEPFTYRKADLQRVMQAFHMLLLADGLLGMVGASLVAFSGLSTLFESRAWQAGVLQAIGVRLRVVVRELLKESLLLGIAGVGLGIPLGIATAKVLLPLMTAAAAINSKLEAPGGELHVRMASLLLAAALGVGAAVVAGTLPAWRAAHVGMAQAMRGRGVEQAAVSTRIRWRLHALGAAAVVVTLLAQALTGDAVWGLTASGLIAVGAALTARPLLTVSRGFFLRTCRWLGGPTGELAIKNVTQNPRRSALTIATMAVGLGCVFWLWMVAGSFETSVIDAVSQAMRADVVVSSAHIQAGFLEAPVSDKLVEDLKHISGTSLVVGERTADLQYAGGPISIDAYDPAYFTAKEFGQWPLYGRGEPDMWDAVARGDAVVVSSNFALNLRASIGDTVTLDSPGGPVSRKIVGVVTHFASPRGTIEMSRALYERYWRDGKVTRVFVKAAPTANVDDLRAAIARELGRRYGLRVLSTAEIVDYFASQVRRAFAGVYVLAALVLTVVLAGTANTLAAGVMERTREIGAIRAVGIRRGVVRRMIFFEALVLGSVGMGLAVGTGLINGMLWVHVTFPALLGWVLQPYIPYAQGGIVVLATMGICGVAAIMPAHRAAALEPAAALRYE